MKYLLPLFFCISSFAGAQAPPPRQKINFDEDWKFHLGHAADPAKDFNFKIANIFSKTGKAEQTPMNRKFDASNWRTLQLPHDWAVELPFVNTPNFDVMAHGYKPVGGLFPETSVGWYRKEFNVARADSGQRFTIQFDGIFRDSKIWINGFYLGNNESGYIGVTYDITDYLDFDQKNVILVRVDATQYEGWFYEGAGIYRHVWLNKYNNLHIAENGVFVYVNVEGGDATVTVQTSVENQNAQAANCGVYVYIIDRQGNAVTKKEGIPLNLTAFGKGTVTQKLVLLGSRLWTLEDPYLYRLVCTVASGDQEWDRASIRFGVRTVIMDAVQGLTLNGYPLKIKGVNCHPDHAGVGSALPDYLQYYRIRLLKEMGVNAYRTSHNAPTPELLDACDSLGMLVMDENRLLNSSPEYMSQLERLILRDRNHASVYMWSIGNEEGYVQTNSTGKRIAQTLLQRQQALDPTRTSTYAADVANVFNGINEVIPVRGFNYRILGVDPYHKDHPDQPIVGTEMGSTVTTRGIYTKDTIRAYVPDQDITAPWWANTAEQWWTLAAERPWWSGGFIWTGFDYRGEPTPYQWPNINSHFGVMDMCGFPKNIYYYYQSWWSDKDVLHISPHWNWKGREGQAIDVWVNSNAEQVELLLNGKSLGKKDMPRNQHLQWSVPYQSGTLEAIGYKKTGSLKSKVETTGQAKQIVLTPDRKTIMADGKDATVINVTVTDSQGREVPDAANLIRFSVTGDARILGVGNGDPSSHEPDQYPDGKYQRHLFGGKCQVILQAGKTKGAIRMEATGDGLQKAQIDIQGQ